MDCAKSLFFWLSIPMVCRPSLSLFIGFGQKSPGKNKTPRSRVVFSFLWKAYRSLGCQSQSAKIMSSTSPYTVSYSIFRITLLSFVPLRIVYALFSGMTTGSLYKVSKFPRRLFDKLHRVLAFCKKITYNIG